MLLCVVRVVMCCGLFAVCPCVPLFAVVCLGCCRVLFVVRCVVVWCVLVFVGYCCTNCCLLLLLFGVRCSCCGLFVCWCCRGCVLLLLLVVIDICLVLFHVGSSCC